MLPVSCLPLGSMSLESLLHCSGVPGLGPAVSILTGTLATLENIKVYRQQCDDMSARCVNLMVSLRDSSEGLEGTKIIEFGDELEAIVYNIDRKVKEWASWNRLKSFLQQRDILDGLNRLNRDIDAAMMKFNIKINMAMSRGQLEAKAIQARDKAEIREVLQTILKSTDDMKALLNMGEARPVEAMMESLQTELRDPTLPRNDEETFRDGLWLLHEKTSKLPPLTDLTGQVELCSNNTVAKGASNDIFRGQWLNKEPVALRLPRTLANNPDAQKRFQREVSIWRELEHPNVVPLFGIIYIGEDVYSVSPWMDNGTAISYVKRIPSVNRLKLLTEAACGLEYLHSRGIVHGDLRGDNVLISKAGVARLSDFGLSKFLADCAKGMTSSENINPRWFAPELFHETGQISTHSDVWSFGMVCLEILSGERPFNKLPRDIVVMHELVKGKTPERPGKAAIAQGLSDEVWNLICRCWNKRPESRPSMTEVRGALLAVQGHITATEHERPGPPGRFGSLFSPGKSRRSSTRPSTASSETSVMSAPATMSTQSRLPLLPSNEIQEDELSPLSSRELFKNQPTIRKPRHNSTASEISLRTFNMEHSPYSTHSNQDGPRDRFHPSQPPRLEVPHLTSSFSLPTRSGSYFSSPDRVTSLENFHSSPSRSVISSDSGVHISRSVREAVINPKAIVVLSDSGTIQGGTLEGLVDRLITNYNSRKDLEYRDILLTACADFTTPDDLFNMLSRRFFEVEMDTREYPEERVAIQYNIFMVMMRWLSNRSFTVDPQLLWQMRNFCESAVRMKSSKTMVDKADDLLQLIDERSTGDVSPHHSLSPGRKMLEASQIKPRDLAIALTLLEGDRYTDLTATDYISHLRRHPGPNNVEGAYTTNNRIIQWVKESILHYDIVEHRAEVLKFFINTAQECLKLRNFSSLVAISSALHSAPIERLKLTKAELTLVMQERLETLEDIISPLSGHRGYREILNEAPNTEERDRCVPWLAVHLKELHHILQQNPTVLHVDGKPLINFHRYVRFMDRIKEVVHYIAPNLEHYRQQGQLAYLEHQLRNLKVSPKLDDDFMERSKALEARDSKDYRSRRRQLRQLGFIR